MSATFEPFRTGGIVAFAPNGHLICAVQGGVKVQIWTSSTQTQHVTPSAGVRAQKVPTTSTPRAISTTTHGAPHDRCGLLATWSALDAVTDITWSPNSAMIAALEPHRRVIEIFSAYPSNHTSTTPTTNTTTKTNHTTVPSALRATNEGGVIARIDTGLNGASSVAWHPSSRALYWFGLAGSFIVSLVDGEVTRLVESSLDGVKLVRGHPTSVRPLEVLEALRPDLIALRKLPPAMTAATRTPLSSVALSKLAVDKGSVLRTAPKTPLLRHSPCGRWLYAITPRAQHALLSEQDAATLALSSPSSMQGGHSNPMVLTNLTNHIQDSTLMLQAKKGPSSSSPAPSQPGGLTDPTLDIEEHLVIMDTASFNTVLRIPVAPRYLRAVTTVHPLLLGHFVLSDDVSRQACLISISHSGDTVVHHTWVDVESIAVSSSVNAVVVIRKGWTTMESILLVQGRYRLMLPLSLHLTGDRLRNEVCAALAETELSCTTEDNKTNAFAPAAYVPMQTAQDAFTTDIAAAASSIRMTGLDAVAGVLSLSDDGKTVALSPPWDIHTVLVITLLDRIVHSVLRHIDPVTSLSFSLPWMRSMPLAVIDAHGGQQAAAAMLEDASAHPTRLCVATATHHGRVFLWSAESASVLTVPTALLPVGQQQRPHPNSALPFCCSQVLWAGSNLLCLADNAAGYFTVVTLTT